MRYTSLKTTCAAVVVAVFALSALPVHALDVNNLPDWVRDSIQPVQVDWSQVYPGLAPAPQWAQEGAGVQQVRPASSSQVDALSGVGTVAPSASATEGLKPVSTGTIVEEINRLKPEDTQAQQLLLTWRSKLERRELDGEGLKQLITEQDIASDTLVAVLDGLPLAHPMDPIYLPVCEVLWVRAADDMESCLELPYAPRIYMATYLGILGREDDAKTLLSSLENPDNLAFGADYYHVACQLLDYEECAFPLAIWCHKRGATLRGPADQAFVCWHIGQACRKADDPKELARRELIPWAEEALARAGSGSRWAHPLRELAWAYREIGEPEKAGAVGRHWLAEASRRRVPIDSLGAAMRALIAVCAPAGATDDARAIAERGINVLTSDDVAQIVAPVRETQLVFGEVGRDQVARRSLLLTMVWPMEVEVHVDTPLAAAEVGAVQVHTLGFFAADVNVTVNGAQASPGAIDGILSIQASLDDPFAFTFEHDVHIDGAIAP